MPPGVNWVLLHRRLQDRSLASTHSTRPHPDPVHARAWKPAAKRWTSVGPVLCAPGRASMGRLQFAQSSIRAPATLYRARQALRAIRDHRLCPGKAGPGHCRRPEGKGSPPGYNPSLHGIARRNGRHAYAARDVAGVASRKASTSSTSSLPGMVLPKLQGTRIRDSPWRAADPEATASAALRRQRDIAVLRIASRRWESNIVAM